ncbi:hypothetical protein JOQ06_006271, partial [Pogonophryne albipinna]
FEVQAEGMRDRQTMTSKDRTRKYRERLNEDPRRREDLLRERRRNSVPYTWGLKQITWNYSERAHGKGAPDGVGGAVKRMADNHVHGGKDLQNPKDLYEFLINREVENIRFKWIDE